MKERHSFTLNAMCRLNVVDYILTSCLLESECSCFIWLSSDLRQRIQFEWLAQWKRMERAYFSSTGQIFLNYKVFNNQALIYIYIHQLWFLVGVRVIGAISHSSFVNVNTLGWKRIQRISKKRLLMKKHMTVTHPRGRGIVVVWMAHVRGRGHPKNYIQSSLLAASTTSHWIYTLSDRISFC